MSEKRSFGGYVFLVILIGIVFLCTAERSQCRADAVEGAAIPAIYQEPVSPALEVFSEGRARMAAGGNIQDGRAKAVVEAEKQALLEALGQMVHPDVVFHERNYVLRALMVKKGSMFIEPPLILGEGPEGDSYVVRMNSRISRERMENILIKTIAARRILVSVSDSVDGRSSGGHALGGAVASAARARGYRVIYLGEFRDEQTRALAVACRSGDREAQKALGLYLLAGALIEGRVQAVYSEATSDIHSSRAGGSLIVMRAGGERTSFSVKDVKGFGSNEKKAGADAIQKASVILSSKTVKSLSGRQRRT